MKICLVGGIYGKPASYRAQVRHTPETVLATGLRARGHEVIERSHSDRSAGFSGADVVHVHHLARGAVLAAAARPATPFVFTPHWFRQEAWSRRVAMRYVINRAAVVIALSDTEARWQRLHYKGLLPRQHVIPNGIDPEIFRFQPPVPPAPGEPWRLLYAGQLAKFKGLEYLLRALASLPSQIHLKLAYHVSTEEAALRTEVSRLGLSSVEFLGPCSPEQLAAHYADCHIFVLPSTGEALPSVISEALFVGRPVVATDVGAVREQVGHFGQIVPPRDPALLSGALAAVIANYARYMAVAENVSQTAVAHCSMDAMIGAHERVYESLVDRRLVSRTLPQGAVDSAVRRTLRGPSAS